METQSDGVLLKGEIKVIARKDIDNVLRVLAKTADGYIISDMNKSTLDGKLVATAGSSFSAFLKFNLLSVVV